jgi:hypothetical protein
VKTVLGSVVMLAFFAGNVAADTFTWTPTPSDLNDLDHFHAYTWRVSGINLGGKTITGATLSINNIYNSDGKSTDRLFVHLLDTAKGAGVSSTIDTSGGAVSDYFGGAFSTSDPLVATGTGNRALETTLNFPSSPATNWTRTLTTSELTTLASFIGTGGDFALGFDPDCHYFNSGVSFTLTTGSSITAVPEPSSIALLGTLALCTAGMMRRRRQRAASTSSVKRAA